MAGVLSFVHEKVYFVDNSMKKLMFVHEMPVLVDKREENFELCRKQRAVLR